MSNASDRPIDDQLKLVFGKSKIGVVAVGADGVVKDINETALNLLNLSAGEGANLPVAELFTLAFHDIPERYDAEQFSAFTDHPFHVKSNLRDNWVSITSLIWNDTAGTPQTYLLVRDVSSFKKRERLTSYLNQAATALANSRDTKSALEQIARFIVPTFANWFTLDLLKDGGLEMILLKHEDPAKIEWAYSYRKNYPPDLNGNAGAGVVVRSGKAAMVPVVTDQMFDLIISDPVQREEIRKIGMHSVIVAPIIVREKVTGLVNFISSNPGNYFDQNDLEFAENFANLVGLVLENTRLNEEAARELALRKQGEEQFKFLVSAIPHKVWTSGPDGRAIYYNERWHHYMGIDGFDELREAIWDFIHPEDRTVAAAEWPAAVKNGQQAELEQRIRRHDGEYRWHLSRFSPHKNELGEVLLWVGTSTDIHEQKTYELELAAINEEMSAANEELEAVNEEQHATNEELLESRNALEKLVDDLEASESRFRFLLNAMPQQVWTATTGGDLTYVNDVICDDFGLPMEEILERGWPNFIHPDDLERVRETWSLCLATGKELVIESRILFHDGTYQWHLTRALPLVEHDEIQFWVGTNTNIELQKQNEERKDEFISIASHELKTPLTSLKASLQLLSRLKNSRRNDMLPVLIEQANRSMFKVNTLVDELLNAKRIKDNKFSLEKRNFILSELINGCCNHIALNSDHNVIISGDKNLVAHADDHSVDQVVVNLVNNAVKYAPDSKDIRITIERHNDMAKVSVADKGPGIPADKLPLIFNRYYQGGVTNYRNPGLGLGLYISSEIIQKNGGKIGVTSEVGKGSTFWFTLPLAK